MTFSRAGRAATIFGLFALLSACGTLIKPDVETGAQALREGEYRLDPEHAAVLWKVDHLGLSTFVGRFDDVEAELSFDPENPEAARLEVALRTTSLNSGVAALDERLRGGGWFDVETWPEARFRSTSVEITGDNTGRVTGDFTLLGVTQPLTLDVAFNGGARNILTQRYTVGFAASATLKRSDYGMDAFLPAVGDDVELEIHVEFQRR